MSEKHTTLEPTFADAIRAITVAAPANIGAVAEKIIDSYWRKDGEVPTTYTINLSCRFVGLAHAISGLDENVLRRLGDIRFTLDRAAVFIADREAQLLYFYF